MALNPTPEAGQAGSIRVGVEALPSGTAFALIFLGDQPAIPFDMVPRLCEALEATGADIAAPRYRDGRGNPVLFRARVFPELAALSGDQGARALIEREPRRVAIVPFDQFMPTDVDTPEDLAALRARGTLGVN
jgi:molybdenum cofactor cytidylyltransferase